MKKSIILLTIVFLLVVTFTSVSLAKVEWVLSSKFPMNSMRGQYISMIADKVKELSDGDFVIEIFPSETLGGTQSTLDQLQSGGINLYIEGLSYMERFNPNFAMFSFPFLFEDMEQWMKFFNSDRVAEWKKSLRENNLAILHIQENGFKVMVTTKPVFSLEDLQGLKLRMWPAKNVERIWSYLGANVIITEYADVYEGLRTGLIEGVTCPLDAAFDMSFAEVGKYILHTDEYPYTVAWLMNAPAYEELSQEYKDILDKALGVGSQWLNANIAAQYEEKLVEGIEKLGVQYTRVSRKEWREKLWELYPQFEEEGILEEGILDYLNSL